MGIANVKAVARRAVGKPREKVSDISWADPTERIHQPTIRSPSLRSCPCFAVSKRVKCCSVFQLRCHAIIP